MTDVITRPSAGSGHDVEGDVRTRDLGDQAPAVATHGPAAGVPASILFDPTRGRESVAAYRFDPTQGVESKSAYRFDATRGRESVAASRFDATRGRESVAAYRFDPTQGVESESAYRFDPTRGRESVASPLQLDLTRWARTKGLSATSA